MVSTFSLSPLAKENESLNHLPLMALKKVLFPIPWGPGKVSTLSNLQPGLNTLVTAATNQSFVCSLTSGLSSAPR